MKKITLNTKKIVEDFLTDSNDNIYVFIDDETIYFLTMLFGKYIWMDLENPSLGHFFEHKLDIAEDQTFRSKTNALEVALSLSYEIHSFSSPYEFANFVLKNSNIPEKVE